MSSDSARWSVKSAVFSSFLSHCLQSSESSEQTPKVCGVINTLCPGPVSRVWVISVCPLMDVLWLLGPFVTRVQSVWSQEIMIKVTAGGSAA